MQYTYIVGKYIICLYELETGRKVSLLRAFLSCFAASAN